MKVTRKTGPPKREHYYTLLMCTIEEKNIHYEEKNIHFNSDILKKIS